MVVCFFIYTSDLGSCNLEIIFEIPAFPPKDFSFRKRSRKKQTFPETFPMIFPG